MCFDIEFLANASKFSILVKGVEIEEGLFSEIRQSGWCNNVNPFGDLEWPRNPLENNEDGSNSRYPCVLIFISPDISSD